MAVYRYEHNSSGSFAVNLSTIWFQAYCSFSLLQAETFESLREDRLADLLLPIQKNGSFSTPYLLWVLAPLVCAFAVSRLHPHLIRIFFVSFA